MLLHVKRQHTCFVNVSTALMRGIIYFIHVPEATFQIDLCKPKFKLFKISVCVCVCVYTHTHTYTYIVPVHTMKADRGNRDITPLILNFSARWRPVVKITPQLLHSWERTPVPIE
jgi:hypothetical protein